MALTGQEQFDQFRLQYPFLSYEGFTVHPDTDGVRVEYLFNLSDAFQFRPGFKIPYKQGYRKKLLGGWLHTKESQNILFHIGMIELISYWKTCCPPSVIVKNHSLDEFQVNFWKKTYYLGLGEFFYTNGIATDPEGFMTILSEGERIERFSFETSNSILVPIGGGKDSVVTLELLKKEMDVIPFILNPRGASLETCFKAGFSIQHIGEIQRKLDPLLLRLNEEGFLNGHTPFSALLAFYTLLVAYLLEVKDIALSNESSANEPTVAGSEVNHQYSKSFEFERDFRDYVSRYLSKDFNYFSFLRPLSELQIAMLFSRNVKYYPVFKSCNVGSKTDSWCGKCPKCLFAWTILSPFIPKVELIHIFGRDLFEDPDMIRYLKELTGIEDVKPFECVGTIDEVNLALQLFIKENSTQKWPLLIDYYSNTSSFTHFQHIDAQVFLKQFNPDHFLTPFFLSIIKREMG